MDQQAKETIQASEPGLYQLLSALQKARPTLEQRLADLDNPYHNLDHAREVHWAIEEFFRHLAKPDLLSQRKKLLLKEAALRHDDGHSGRAYRQEDAGDGMSNEEYAAWLAEKDLASVLPQEDLEFIQANILATAFGQADRAKLPKPEYYRSYQAETPAQKLLVLADVARFIKGWRAWLEGELRLLEEMPQRRPDNFNNLLERSKRFLETYVHSLIEQAEGILEPSYLNQLKQSLEKVKQKLISLKDPNNPDREEYRQKFEALKLKLDS